MSDEQISNSQYQKGFNEGYLITKHLPELSNSLAKVKSDSPRMEGFNDGRREFALEQVRENRPALMKETTFNPPEPNKGKDLGREPER